MKLYDILENINYLEIYNKQDITVNTVSIDSRVLKDIFVGIKGETFDGSDFLSNALSLGFKVCVVEKINNKSLLNSYKYHIIKEVYIIFQLLP